MSDQPKPNPRNLSEISHLFLDSVRERQTGGAPRPVRKPPGSPRNDVSIDLTPEEFAQVFGDHDPFADDDGPAVKQPPVAALISAHLNGRQVERVKEYARHLAASGARIGMIEIDASEFRLTCFDCGTPDSHGEILDLDDESFDPRRMAEALDEMNHDVDQWLLLLPSPRVPEARALLRQVEQWVLLSTCDHDGVVSCYRTLKGLSDLHRPVLSLALLEAHDDAEAGKVFGKLSSVCQQFLGWPLVHEAPVIDARHVAEHLVMACRPTRDKAQLASAPQWRIVEDFLVKHKGAAPMPQQATLTPSKPARHDDDAAEFEPMQAAPAKPMRLSPAPAAARSVDEAREHVGDFVVPAASAPAAAEIQAEARPIPSAAPAKPAMTFTMAPAAASGGNDVIDLTDGDARPESIIAAILAHHAGEMIETPVRAPMCPTARLAVTRDRQVVLVAVAGQGLGEIRAIGQAYRWLQENRSLIAMAVPQFSIDAHQLPRLRLLVDHADVSADVLQPMLQSGNVTVQAYRKLRWGQKTGLLLEAA